MSSGLRERKKAEQRLAIGQAAFELFAERGFDAVTVAEVAEKAGTSVQTVFNYFPVKEDLLLVGRAYHEEKLVEAVIERPAGMSVIEAVRLRVHDAAEEFARLDPVRTGQFRAIVLQSPSIMTRLKIRSAETEAAIAAHLAGSTGAAEDDPRPRIVASILMSLAHLPYTTGAGGLAATHRKIDQAASLIATGLAGYAVADQRA